MASAIVYFASRFVDQRFVLEILLKISVVGTQKPDSPNPSQGNDVLIKDLGSTNGTMVNGQRVSAVALNPGDMIQLGTTTLTFRVDG